MSSTAQTVTFDPLSSFVTLKGADSGHLVVQLNCVEGLDDDDDDDDDDDEVEEDADNDLNRRALENQTFTIQLASHIINKITKISTRE